MFSAAFTGRVLTSKEGVWKVMITRGTNKMRKKRRKMRWSAEGMKERKEVSD
jgi:hypothetical protein